MCGRDVLVFLPTYSPELNPCKLVFANVKQFMTAYRGHGSLLEAEIYRAFANATDLQKVAAQYQRSILKKDIQVLNCDAISLNQHIH
eukprot:g16373.t1